MRYLLPFLAIVMLVAGCSRQQDDALTAKPDEARLTIGDVLRIAKQEAKRHDVDLKRYEEPVARYQVSREDGMWSVSFKEVGFPRPGYVFLIIVDDKTGEASFIPGR